MSLTTIARLSGIAFLLGGGLSALGTLGQMVDDNPLSALWLPASLAIAVGLLLVLLGLPVLYARQMKRAGMLGLIGFILFALACFLFGGSSGLTDLVLLPLMTQSGALATPSLAFLLYFLIAKLLILVGSVVFAIATLRAGVLPKGAALLLLGGSVLFIVGGRVHIPRLDFFGEILFLLSFIWLGISLLSPAEQESASSHARTEIRA